MASPTFWGLFWLNTLYRGFCVVSEDTLVATAYLRGIVMLKSERFIYFLCWLFLESWQ